MLTVPFTPERVQITVDGGQVVLPQVIGELQATVRGGTPSAEVVRGTARVSVNGGNLTVEQARGLMANVNGGNLRWAGELREGTHFAEVNGGQATILLREGSDVRVAAQVSMGSFSADFPTEKTGRFMNAKYQGQLGKGNAQLALKVTAGQGRAGRRGDPMTEKVRQILELLRRERLNWQEVQALLVALEPRLSLSDSQREMVDSLLAKADLPTHQIAGHLLVMCGANSAALAEKPLLEAMPATVPPTIEQALIIHAAPPVDAAPRVLNVTLLADGAVIHQVNVPLGLLPQLEKLLPARGRQVLEASAFGVETIAMLIAGGAPIGDLFGTQDEAGTVLQFALK